MLNKKQPLNQLDTLHFTYLTGFPGVLVVKNSSCQCSRSKRWEFYPHQEDALEKEMVAHSSILASRIPGTEELVGCSP